MLSKDFVYVGSCPSEEDCVQVWDGVEYWAAMRKECRAYVLALKRKLGEPPDGARLVVKAERHDFGGYYEVVGEAELVKAEAWEWVLKCEAEGPRTWAEVGMRVEKEVVDGVVEVTVWVDGEKWMG